MCISLPVRMSSAVIAVESLVGTRAHGETNVRALSIAKVEHGIPETLCPEILL